jgi:hypothetical protein
MGPAGNPETGPVELSTGAGGVPGDEVCLGLL